MANPFTQYLRDTRGELRHVAWPTQTQTIVYTLLVAGISIAIAVYLGFFDFLFTGALGHFLSAVPQGTPAAQTQTASTSSAQALPAIQTSPITVTQSPAASTNSAKSPASSGVSPTTK